MKKFILFGLICLGINIQAQNSHIALVIGNADYQHGEKMKYPVSDAYLMGFTLEDLGFEVVSATNTDSEKMQALAEEFLGKLGEAGMVMIYYAGMAVETGGSNYLIPVDVDPGNDRDIKKKALDLNALLGSLGHKSSLPAIVAVDATGAGPMEIDGQLLLAFSDQAGSGASELAGGANSLYAEKLTQQMMLSQSVNEVFKHTALLVKHQSRGERQPMHWSNLDQSTGLRSDYIPREPGNGSIVMTSSFSGSVLLNGLEIGNIEAGGMVPLDNMEPGTYHLAVDGEENWSDSVLVLADQLSNVNIEAQQSTVADTMDIVVAAAPAVAAPIGGSGNMFVDPRDNYSYPWMEFGDQTWMLVNLAYESENSYCYDGREDLCEKYGRFYTWEAALNACPEGWHLPTDEEWMQLERHLGMGKMFANTMGLRGGDLGNALKDTIQGEWKVPKDGYFGANGFNALPAGYNMNHKKSVDQGKATIFWTATESNYFESYYRKLVRGRGGIHRYEGQKDKGYSVRCVKDL